jgi:hypothetical protein
MDWEALLREQDQTDHPDGTQRNSGQPVLDLGINRTRDNAAPPPARWLGTIRASFILIALIIAGALYGNPRSPKT